LGLFANVSYTASAHDLHELPADVGAEIAFVGRSNAGKSSAINTLANHTRRTQLINFFSMGPDRYLVDLPGYGFAKVPPTVKAHWERVLADYVSGRKALKGLVLIMDARHPLKPADEALLDWYGPTGKPVHCLLTKADKLTRNEQATTLKRVRDQLRLANRNATAQLFSSLKKSGVEDAEKRIAEMLMDA
jgi:GTP-binding protein